LRVSALGILVAFLLFAQPFGTLRQPWAVCRGPLVGMAALPSVSAVFCLAVLPLLWLCLLVRARLVARFWLLLPPPPVVRVMCLGVRNAFFIYPHYLSPRVHSIRVLHVYHTMRAAKTAIPQLEVWRLSIIPSYRHTGATGPRCPMGPMGPWAP